MTRPFPTGEAEVEVLMEEVEEVEEDTLLLHVVVEMPILHHSRTEEAEVAVVMEEQAAEGDFLLLLVEEMRMPRRFLMDEEAVGVIMEQKEVVTNVHLEESHRFKLLLPQILRCEPGVEILRKRLSKMFSLLNHRSLPAIHFHQWLPNRRVGEMPVCAIPLLIFQSADY